MSNTIPNYDNILDKCFMDPSLYRNVRFNSYFVLQVFKLKQKEVLELRIRFQK